jgi:hypothetical protein
MSPQQQVEQEKPRSYEVTVRQMFNREDELINHRMLWMAAFNGLLFTALGTAWDKPGAGPLTLVFAILGVASAALSGVALFYASNAQRQLLRWWHANRPTDYAGPGMMASEPPDKRGFSFYVTPWTALSALFAGGWLAVLILVLERV